MTVSDERLTATAVMAHEMVTLEFLIKSALDAQHYARAERLERQREDLQFERSLLMRQLWRYGQRP